VFGSLLASRYANQLVDVVGELPDRAADAVSGSLAGALRVSSEAPGPQGLALADAAKSAWMDGFRFSLLIAGLVVAVAGLVAWRFLPDQAVDLPLEADLSDDELALVSED
jgi:DHA2 family multidrug resistance protein-like MFS transporter